VLPVSSYTQGTDTKEEKTAAITENTDKEGSLKVGCHHERSNFIDLQTVKSFLSRFPQGQHQPLDQDKRKGPEG